jgi:hypothetical protein
VSLQLLFLIWIYAEVVAAAESGVISAQAD